MIIRDSTTPKGRRVDVPAQRSPLDPIAHQLHRASPRSWHEAAEASWAYRVRTMEDPSGRNA